MTISNSGIAELEFEINIEEDDELSVFRNNIPFTQNMNTTLVREYPTNQTNNNVEYVKVNPSEKGVDISTVLEDLANRGCINIFVEGGKDILGSLFDLNLVNKVVIFISPKGSVIDFFPCVLKFSLRDFFWVGT